MTIIQFPFLEGVGFHPLDESQLAKLRDSRENKKRIDKEFEDYRRDHV